MSDLKVDKVFVLVQFQNKNVHQVIVNQVVGNHVLETIAMHEGSVRVVEEPLQGIEIKIPEYKTDIEDAEFEQTEACDDLNCDNPICHAIRGQLKLPHA